MLDSVVLGGGSLLLLTLLFYTSTTFNYIAKFTYLYVVYMCMGIIISLLCLPWPKHPGNGLLTARIMKFINRRVSIEWTLEGVEHLNIPSGAVILLNHQSAIDVIAICELWPAIINAAPVAKKSLMYAGPFGLACWLLGTVFIDRSSTSSRDDVNSAGKCAMEKGVKLIIFPEGTRNSAKNLSMKPFRKGAFHVAVHAQMPIIPVVISEYDFLDHRGMVFRPGQARIRVLPPVDTSAYTGDNLNELVETTRNKMLATLKDMAEKKEKTLKDREEKKEQ